MVSGSAQCLVRGCVPPPPGWSPAASVTRLGGTCRGPPARGPARLAQQATTVPARRVEASCRRGAPDARGLPCRPPSRRVMVDSRTAPERLGGRVFAPEWRRRRASPPASAAEHCVVGPVRRLGRRPPSKDPGAVVVDSQDPPPARRDRRAVRARQSRRHRRGRTPPRGSPGVRPRTRGCPTIPASRGGMGEHTGREGRRSPARSRRSWLPGTRAPSPVHPSASPGPASHGSAARKDEITVLNALLAHIYRGGCLDEAHP